MNLFRNSSGLGVAVWPVTRLIAADATAREAGFVRYRHRGFVISRPGLQKQIKVVRRRRQNGLIKISRHLQL